MRVRFRPMVWVGPQTPPNRRRSEYMSKTTWHDTVDLLERELGHLGAAGFVIEADFAESDLDGDGIPRANARQPNFPGVRIAFESKHGPLSYQTDRCDFWQNNVSAIAQGLLALRSVDSYGITPSAQQYTGFRASGSGPRTAEVAAIKSVLRLVARHTHPDHGGTREQWDRYQQAHRVLSEAGMI